MCNPKNLHYCCNVIFPPVIKAFSWTSSIRYKSAKIGFHQVIGGWGYDVFVNKYGVSICPGSSDKLTIVYSLSLWCSGSVHDSELGRLGLDTLQGSHCVIEAGGICKVAVTSGLLVH